jgi:hypothetical protein
MSLLQLNAIEDAEASGEVARIYGDIQRALSIPFVPNLEKVLANAPNVLNGQWGALDETF